jgi:hypothetical protein
MKERIMSDYKCGKIKVYASKEACDKDLDGINPCKKELTTSLLDEPIQVEIGEVCRLIDTSWDKRGDDVEIPGPCRILRLREGNEYRLGVVRVED